MKDKQVAAVADSLAKSFHGLMKSEPRREILVQAAKDAIEAMTRHQSK